MSNPAGTESRPGFALGLLAGLLVCVPSGVSVWAFVDSETLSTAATISVGATLATGIACLFARRWRRFGAGLAVAALGVVLATFLFLWWLVVTVGP